MNKFSTSTLLGALIIFSGCSSPLVKYGQIQKSDEKGLAKFSLSESVIKFNLKKSSLGAIEGVDIVSVPVPEASGKIFYIAGTSVMENWGVETVVVPAYRGDTTLLKSIAVTTTDKRVTYIEKGAGLIAKAIGFFVSATNFSADKLPDGVAVQPLLDACDNPPKLCTRTFTPSESPKYEITLTIGALPLDKFVFPVTSDTVYKSGAFLYSACRQVDVQLYFTSNSKREKIAESTLTVADSKFVQALAFPEKGTITAGASCGATAAAEASSNPDAMGYVDAFMGAAQTIAKASKDGKDARAAADAKK